MKTLVRIFLVMTLLFLYQGSIAQSSKLIVFAPKGEKFTLFVSNTRQNSEPQARVEADCPGGPTFKFKVTFSDPSIPEISKLLFNKPNHTFYYQVDKNAKGVYVLVSTSSEWSDQPKASAETPPPAKEQKQAVKEEPAKSKPAKETGGKGCSNPMEEPAFIAALVSVSSPPFDPSKLSAAKKLATEHCLTTLQVKQVIYVFDYESTRLSFAKFAYEHTWDPDHYSDVSEALHNTKSRNELEQYIKSKK
jgi:hypothetical protein